MNESEREWERESVRECVREKVTELERESERDEIQERISGSLNEIDVERKEGEIRDKGFRVISLAGLFGASVHGAMKRAEEKYFYLANSLPDWITQNEHSVSIILPSAPPISRFPISIHFINSNTNVFIHGCDLCDLLLFWRRVG